MYDAQYFPNCVLYTHEGKRVKFYDDLIKNKLVAINMMYAQCEGICPISTANLRQVQQALGERVGRDIFMYSITLDPEHDTPEVLKEYVEARGIEPGWLFLTGKRADIEVIRLKLGFSDPDPLVDGDRAQHTGMITIGNDPYDRWHMTPALGDPEPIVDAILHADRAQRPAKRVSHSNSEVPI
jgi:protein SCO1/2